DETPPVTTREIIRFWNEHYGESIADSSYDDVRRKDLIWLVEGGLVAKSAGNPTADTNDGTRGYSLTEEAHILIRSYGRDTWEEALITFRNAVGQLKDRLSKAREFKGVPVKLPEGKKLTLSPGPHNKLQQAIIEEFLPRYAKSPKVLYIGDTAKKILLHEEEEL
ncbi:DNA (cytosine-5-)-methyltransferase, partial [Aduncisulcus paluster]